MKYQTGALTADQCRVLAEALTLYCEANPIPEGEVGGDGNRAAELLEWFDEPQTHLIPLPDED